MTNLIKITIAFLFALLLSSCGFDINLGDFSPGERGNGIVVEDPRAVTDDFTEISVSEGLHAYVTQGDDFEIMVEADENIVDLIGTDIKNGKLRIHAIENIGRATKKIHVVLPKVSGLKSSSGAHLNVVNTIKSDKLEIDGSSGANVNAEIVAEDVDIDASSGANLNISGEADAAYVDVSSGGNINARSLITQNCKADASSGGNLSINVSESLTADASSGGNISYMGEASVQSKKNLSGSITKRD
ncbi:MAG: head GIN domain-containing protein [Bacteroidota bacterium]